MKIINASRQTIISGDAVIANSLFSRVKGLLGKKEFKAGSAIILKPCNSIHTFFMKFPIDVMFLDKRDKVVKVIHSLKPNRITSIYWRASYVIELPADTFKKFPTAASDIIEIIL